jgi:hypothetical protein
MNISCIICLEYNNPEKADKILRSVQVDDFDFVTSKVKDKTLEATINSRSVSSLLHTLDDYLACLSIAEKIVDKNQLSPLP